MCVHFLHYQLNAAINRRKMFLPSTYEMDQLTEPEVTQPQPNGLQHKPMIEVYGHYWLFVY